MEKFPLWEKEPQTELEWFQALVALTRFLRSPDGCPWDRGKTALDFARYAGEESDEYCEALLSGDNAHAEEEFGDAFFTLLASLSAAEAEGRFTLLSALKRAHTKMVRRHAHVFSANQALTPEDAMASWNAIKAVEKDKSNEF